jgi:hypothetical protein
MHVKPPKKLPQVWIVILISIYYFTKQHSPYSRLFLQMEGVCQVVVILRRFVKPKHS